MIRRLRFLGAAPRSERDRTEAEAQRLARKAAVEALEQEIEALRKALAERDTTIIQLTAKLRVAQFVQHTPGWMAHGMRAQDTLDGPTQVVAQSELRKRWRTVGHR